MGQINISVIGSFKPNHAKQFGAIDGGHAQAVGLAIKWLSEVLLPEAIKNDHMCHDKGVKPTIGWGEVKPSEMSGGIE